MSRAVYSGTIRCNVAAAYRSALHRCALSHAAECVPCGVYWPKPTHTGSGAHVLFARLVPMVPLSNCGHPLLAIDVIRYRTHNDDDRDRGEIYGVALRTRFAEGDVDAVTDTRFLSALAPLLPFLALLRGCFRARVPTNSLLRVVSYQCIPISRRLWRYREPM